MKAFVFPGQGGQFIGMGKELYASDVVARAVFDEVDSALGEKLSALMFDGSAEELNLTKNVQPAIFAVSAAMWRAATAKGELSAEFVLGHSLGEYSALWVAGCAGLGDMVRLLRRRGELMQSAVPDGEGAMAAIIGDIDVSAVVATATAEAKGVCDMANDNGAGQWVVSGNGSAVDRAVEIAKEKGAKIAKRLAVSVPAHSSLIQPAAYEFKNALSEIEFRAPVIKFVSNKTAAIMSDIYEIKEALLYQLTHGVHWRESVLNLTGLRVDEFIEVGPGNILTGMNKRIVPDANCYKLEL